MSPKDHISACAVLVTSGKSAGPDSSVVQEQEHRRRAGLRNYHVNVFGAAGGKLVAAGTPEQVARVAGSYTGQVLGGVLARLRG